MTVDWYLVRLTQTLLVVLSDQEVSALSLSFSLGPSLCIHYKSNIPSELNWSLKKFSQEINFRNLANIYRGLQSKVMRSESVIITVAEQRSDR